MVTEPSLRRVLVHVGYPKAASTTLQNGVFMDLHREGRINFMARAWESGHFGPFSTHREYKGWLRSLLNASLDGGQVPPLPGSDNLAADRVNLFSEGLLMNNERQQEGFFMPAAVSELFGQQADDLRVLMVIRRQPSLLMSYFVHNFKRLGCRSFAEFLDKCTQENWSGRAKIFNFHEASAAYARLFGKDRVHILLFEDMVQDPATFAEGLAPLLGLASEEVEKAMQGKHFNNTPKAGGAQVVRKTQPYSPRAIARRFLGALPGSLGQLFDIKVPRITPEQDEAIMALFRDSNTALAAEFDLDIERMRAYRFC